MIQVIKHGNTIRTYKCPDCGCVFIADQEEYECKAYILCPECRTTVFSRDTTELNDSINESLIEEQMYLHLKNLGPR